MTIKGNSIKNKEKEHILIWLGLIWFWFIFDLDNELITIIDLKIETNNITLDYNTL